MSLSSKNTREVLVDEWENKSTFVDQLREKYDHLFQKIAEHPFLLEIEEGKLPLEKFLFYAKQNEYYISELRSAASAGAARATTDSERRIMMMIVSMFPLELSEYCFGKLSVAAGVPDEEIKAILEDPDFPLPATRAYTDFMYKEFATKPAGVATASFITCPWTYSSVDIGGLSCGKTFAKALHDHYGVDKKITEEYIEHYETDEDFAIGIKALKDAVNKDAEEGNDKMRNILESNFKRDVEYEYMFWEMAYKHNPGKEREFGSYF